MYEKYKKNSRYINRSTCLGFSYHETSINMANFGKPSGIQVVFLWENSWY